MQSLTQHWRCVKLQTQTCKKPGFHFLVPSSWITHQETGVKALVWMYSPSFSQRTIRVCHSYWLCTVYCLGYWSDYSQPLLLTLHLILWTTSYWGNTVVEIGSLSFSILLVLPSLSSWAMMVIVLTIKPAPYSLSSFYHFWSNIDLSQQSKRISVLHHGLFFYRSSFGGKRQKKLQLNSQKTVNGQLLVCFWLSARLRRLLMSKARKKKHDNVHIFFTMMIKHLDWLISRQTTHSSLGKQKATLSFITGWQMHFLYAGPWNFMPCGRKNWIVKERLIVNQSKHRWCHYSMAVTLCNQHLLHSEKLKQKFVTLINWSVACAPRRIHSVDSL